MDKDLEKAKSLLISEGYTCVLVNGDATWFSRERGVKPLVDCVNSDTDWTKYAAADKVVGKAAALLYVKLGIKGLYAATLSKSAAEVLKKYGVKFSFGLYANAIINRKGDGICPMEKAVSATDNPDIALEKIKSALFALNRQSC